MLTTNMGYEGFIWFIGEVVDNNDPEQLGRLKIRTVENLKIETEDLSWAYPIMPMNSASLQGQGISPTGIQLGSTVFGFYLDSINKQHPVLFGTYHKILKEKNDVSKYARGIGPVQKTRLDYEPPETYKAEYPHNKTITTGTDSNIGHVIEIDDTPENERIHIYHKSGAYVVIEPTGSIVTKSPNTNIEISINNKEIYVDKGDFKLETKEGDIFITAVGDNAKIEVKTTGEKSDIEIKATGKGSVVDIKAPKVKINS